MVTRYTQKNLAWIDLVAPTPEEVRALMHEFGFNPLLAQELLSVSTNSKVERFDDTIYAVFHFPVIHSGKVKRTSQEVDVVIGKGYLITTRYEDITSLRAFAKAFEVDSVLAPEHHHLHGGHLFAALMRNLYRALVLESDVIKTRLDEVGEHLFDTNQMRLVADISNIGGDIYDFRQALAPHKEMLHSLEAPIELMFGREFSYYMRGIIAEYEHLQSTAEALRDSMIELRETNNSLLNAKQNEVMKNFSVLAFVFVPVSLIMGLYQMGLPNTPFAGQIDFWAVLGALVLVTSVLFIYFRRKGWI